MNNSTTLIDLTIVSYSLVKLNLYQYIIQIVMDIANSVRLQIKTMDNKISILVSPLSASVLDMKQQVEKITGIPLSRQRLIFQGKMMEDSDILTKYNFQDDCIVHLIAHIPETTVAVINNTSSIEDLVASTQSITQDLEVLSGILRNLRQTTFNRQNLRRVIMQQRVNGFNIDRVVSLESVRQNFDNIQQMIECQVTIADIGNEDIQRTEAFINPFKFKNRKLKIGQWIDLKDTIDQWLEAQVVDIKDGMVCVHYNGWAKRWDEWIEIDSSRIALFRTYTVGQSVQEYMSPLPVTNPDSENLEKQDVDMNEFIFDVGFLMNKITANLIDFGKYQNFKRLKEKQLQLQKQQHLIQQIRSHEESKDQFQGEQEYIDEIMLLSTKSSLMGSQQGPIFDRMGRMMIDMAPHLALLGAQTQTIEDLDNSTHVFQVPILLTPSEISQTQIQSQFLYNGNPFDAINSRLGYLRQYIDRQNMSQLPVQNRNQQDILLQEEIIDEVIIDQSQNDENDQNPLLDVLDQEEINQGLQQTEEQ